MVPSKVKHQSFQARLSSENHEWLRQSGNEQERSINWMLNKVVTDARMACEREKGDEKQV